MQTFRLTSRVLPPSREPPQHARGGGVPESSVSSARAGTAVPVPWCVVRRSRRGMLEIEHCGETPLRAVRFALAGGGLLGLSLPRTVHPGERVRVVLRGVHADGATDATDAMLVLRWLQPDGTELLWPIAL